MVEVREMARLDRARDTVVLATCAVRWGVRNERSSRHEGLKQVRIPCQNEDLGAVRTPT